MKNPYTEQSHDKSGEAMPEFALPKTAASTIGSENAAVSSVITLTDNTTTVEVGAFGTGAVVKWITIGDTESSVVSAGAGGGNYDVIIPLNYIRRLPVPMEVTPTASSLSGGGANSANGLYKRLAYKTLGIGSILTVQYP